MAQSRQPAVDLHRRVLCTRGHVLAGQSLQSLEAWAKEAGITFSQQKLTVRRNIERRGRSPTATRAVIPTRADPHALAQSRRPMDMMIQGWSMRRFHAEQQWSTMSA